jgi:hypothetical protein
MQKPFSANVVNFGGATAKVSLSRLRDRPGDDLRRKPPCAVVRSVREG